MATPRPLRVSVDVNIWLAYLLGLAKNRVGTAPMEIVRMVSTMRIGARQVQLIVAQETLGTLQAVAAGLGVPLEDVSALTNQIAAIARFGPEGLDPFIFFGRETLQMKDQEDAGVLAAAIAGRADFLLTDNLKDFRNKDAETIETGTVMVGSRERSLFCVIHEREDGVAVIVAHPVNFLEWVRIGLDLSPHGVRGHYAAAPKPGKKS